MEENEHPNIIIPEGWSINNSRKGECLIYPFFPCLVTKVYSNDKK